MISNDKSLNSIRNLNQIELQSYLSWYSQLSFYRKLVKLLTLNFSSNRLEEKIFLKLGEVPRTNIHQVQIFCKDYLSGQNAYNFSKQFMTKLINSIYISFLLNSWSRKNPRSVYMNKAGLIILQILTEKFASRKKNSKESIGVISFLTPTAVSAMVAADDYLIQEEILLSGCGLMYRDNSVFSSDPAVGECEFQAGLWDKIRIDKESGICTLKGKLKSLNSIGRIELALDLTGRCGSNYWHFVCEYLPRIFNANSVPTDLPILINSDTPLTCQILLNYYFPKNDVFAIPADAWIEVGKLISPKFLTKCLDSGDFFPEDKFSWDENSYTNSLKKINSIYKVSTGFNHGDRVYLKRQTTLRSVENDHILETFLINCGFEVVSPEKLSIEEQIFIFRQAKIVVGIGGSVWANLVFANPELLAISLVSAAAAPNDVHLQLSKLLGINFQRIVCQTTSELVRQNYSRIFYRDYAHSSFVIDDTSIEELRKMINES